MLRPPGWGPGVVAPSARKREGGPGQGHEVKRVLASSETRSEVRASDGSPRSAELEMLITRTVTLQAIACRLPIRPRGPDRVPA